MEHFSSNKLKFLFNSPKRYKNNFEYTHIHNAMGTLITQKISFPEPGCKEIAEIAVVIIKELEQAMSYYDNSSQVKMINRMAGKEWVRVNPEVFFIVKESKKYSRLTKGFFDITVAAISALWQHYGESGQIPPESLIKEKLKIVNYEDILMEKENKKIKLSKPGQKIDLGGIAKGYAANKLVQFYKKTGIISALINLGGNVSLLGSRHDGHEWQVGIQNPDKKRGQCLGILRLTNTSIVTSGDYERIFLIDKDRSYHHIINPKNGYPSRGKLKSVTIIHPDSLLADVLSTTCFIIGLMKSIELIKDFKGVEFILLNNSNEIYISKNLVKKFQLIEEGFSPYQIG